MLAEIEKIPIVDNHANVPNVPPAEDIAAVPSQHAVPKHGFEPYPARLRYTHSEWQQAWRLLWDPALSGSGAHHQTKFVLVHGGWPFDDAVGPMLFKPNVYADFSAQTFLRSPSAVADTLAGWLAFQPQKVLFGSDTHSDRLMGVDNAFLWDWEEKLAICVRSGRRALALALERLLTDGVIMRDEALAIARQVLRDNAMSLYGLP